MLLNKVYAVIIGIEVVSPPRIFSHEGSHVLFDLWVQPRFLKERLVDLFRDHGAKLRGKIAHTGYSYVSNQNITFGVEN